MHKRMKIILHKQTHASPKNSRSREANPKPLRARRQPRLRRGHLAAASPPGFACGASRSHLVQQNCYHNSCTTIPTSPFHVYHPLPHVSPKPKAWQYYIKPICLLYKQVIGSKKTIHSLNHIETVAKLCIIYVYNNSYISEN